MQLASPGAPKRVNQPSLTGALKKKKSILNLYVCLAQEEITCCNTIIMSIHLFLTTLNLFAGEIGDSIETALLKKGKKRYTMSIQALLSSPAGWIQQGA